MTGDRIRCDFQINGVCMGGSLFASRRQIQAHVETEAPLDKIVLYKNGRAVRIINGEFFRQVNQTGCYKIRIEMGWGDPSLYHWEGSVKTGEGVIESFQTYFRGRSVLAPQKGEEYDESRINDIAAFSERRGEGEIAWSCDTTGNKSTLHPCTSSVVIKVRGGARYEAVSDGEWKGVCLHHTGADGIWIYRPYEVLSFAGVQGIQSGAGNAVPV